LVHFRLAQYEQALADIAKTVELRPDDVSNLTWIPLEDVASCPDEKFRTGMLALADKMIQIFERKRKKDGPKSAETAAWLAMQGGFLLARQQYVEAEPILRECLAIREQKLPDEWVRYNALSALGGALLGQKKYAEAEPLLLEGYQGMKQREAKMNYPFRVVRLAEAAERLVRLYEATNQPEKARAWREKLAAQKHPDDRPGAPGTQQPPEEKSKR
jgi:hypothetical protein